MNSLKRIAPPRKAFGPDEISAVQNVIEYYSEAGEDPPYDGVFQKRLEDNFSEKMKGGYSLAVSTGTAACFVALRALKLPRGTEVIVSPVSDSGSLFSIVECGLIPVIVDTASTHTYNTNLSKIIEAISDKTSAIFLVHCGGHPVDLDSMQGLKKLNIPVIEDCSQAPFAKYCGVCTGCDRCSSNDYVGSLGDIAVFSAMYRKSIQMGGSGGIVFTRKKGLYQSAVEQSDRGRLKWREGFRPKDPNDCSGSALNFCTNEFSCAIGNASLNRIDETINRRLEFLKHLSTFLSGTGIFLNLPPPMNISPFYFALELNDKLKKHKTRFCELASKSGIDLAVSYQCVLSDWNFIDQFPCRVVERKNVMQSKRNLFNLFLNENHNIDHAKEIAKNFINISKLIMEKK